jgi:hypothetical protein
MESETIREEDRTSTEEKEIITRLSKTQHILAHSKSVMTQTSQLAHLAVLEASKVIIIRHANSTFNNRWSQIEKEI